MTRFGLSWMFACILLVAATGTALSQTSTPALTLTTSGPVTITPGAVAKVLIRTSALNGFNSAVSFTSSGTWTGVTSAYAPASLAAPGNGVTVLTISSSTSSPIGSFNVTVDATGGGRKFQITVKVTVTKSATLLVSSWSSVTIGKGQSLAIGVVTSAMYGFKSSVALTATSNYSGLTTKLSPSTILAPGSGNAVIYVSASAGAIAGTYYLTITASGGGQTCRTFVPIVVMNPNLTVATSGSVSVTAGQLATVSVSTAASYGFNSTVALSSSTSTAGVSASLTPTSLAAPGSGTSKLTVRTSPSTPIGSFSIIVTAKGGGLTKTTTVGLTVQSPGTPSSPSVGHLVTVDFSPSATPNVTYNLYRCVGSTTVCAQSWNFQRVNITPVTAAPYVDLAVSTGLTYYYTVTAVDSRGIESDMSNIAAATVPN